jgi:hypothetical protein
MTVKNKAVKGCGGLPPLFTNCREEVFSETQLPKMWVLGNYSVRARHFAEGSDPLEKRIPAVGVRRTHLRDSRFMAGDSVTVVQAV